MIRGTKRKLDSTPNKRFDVSASIHNRFDIEVVDVNSGEVKQKVFAENVICNQLWTRLCSNGTYNYAVNYGDGIGTPSASDTTLFSHLGYIVSELHKLEYDYDNEVFICTRKAVMDETTAVGKTITEVGIAYTNTPTSLVTHAMLKDMNGNPVSLKKTDTDVFNIYATIFCHFRLPSEHVHIMGSYIYDGSYYYSTLLGHIMGLASIPACYLNNSRCNSMALGSKESVVSYDVTRRMITLTFARLAADEFNDATGLCSFYITHDPDGAAYGGFPIMVFYVDEDDGWYGKTEIRGEALGTGDGQTVDFSTAFPYAKNVTVYVNGIPAECTVDTLNHKVYGWKESKPCVEYPLLAYFKLLRSPEVGEGYYNRPYHLPPLVMPSSGSSYNSTYNTSGYTEPAIYENPICDTHGVYQIYRRSCAVKASNDLNDWVDICDKVSSTGTITVPEEYRHYKYWALYGGSGPFTGSYYYGGIRFISTDDSSLKSVHNIHLVEPPAEGAVVTIDYDTVCVAKDANHVFDFSVTFQFNEYNEG